MNESESDKALQGLSTRERSIISKFLRKSEVTITSKNLAAMYNITRPLANKILLRLEKKGWLQRSKRGIYIFIPLTSMTAETVPEDPWALAMDLFKPCYISGFSAAEHWALTEQVFNTVIVFTTRKQRKSLQIHANVKYQTHFISTDLFFGMKKIWRNNFSIMVADPHKTIIDILNNTDAGGGGRHTMDIVYSYWKSDEASPDVLLEYALKMKRKTILKRLGFSAELWGGVTEKWLNECKANISRGISNLDPSGPSTGKIATQWKLRINVPLEEYK